MTARLRALLVAVGIVALGGTAYLVYSPAPDVALAALLDAGIAADCLPATATCSVEWHPPDGGAPRHVTRSFRVARCGTEVIVPRFVGDRLGVLDIRHACQVTPGCTDPDICSQLGATKVVPHLCACAKDATCLVDGQPAPMGATLAAGTWSGAGCVPKPCGPVWAGQPDTTWPEECPSGGAP